jgi:hypothetical protein
VGTEGAEGAEEFVGNENPVKALGGSTLDGFCGSNLLIPKLGVVDAVGAGGGAMVLEVVWFKDGSGFEF